MVGLSAHFGGELNLSDQHLFLQDTVAVIWDFDRTLIPGYMQEPLFGHFKVDQAQFWKEVNQLPAFYQAAGLELVSKDTLYLNHILTYVRRGTFKGLSNKMLQQLGKEIKFFEGLPDFFQSLKDAVSSNERFKRHDITVEHYIVSTGLRQMILGSAIAPFVDGVWGCEFVDVVAEPGFEAAQPTLFQANEERPIQDIGYVVDNTSKTRAVFEINKGCNKLTIDVNASIDRANRRVPFENMIYVADGPSDIPVFSILKQYSGKTFAVYKPGLAEAFAQANDLQRQGRIDAFGPADYRSGSHTAMWLEKAVTDVAKSIADKRDAVLADLGRTPHHILSDIKPAAKATVAASVAGATPQTVSGDKGVSPPKKGPEPVGVPSKAGERQGTL